MIESILMFIGACLIAGIAFVLVRRMDRKHISVRGDCWMSREEASRKAAQYIGRHDVRIGEPERLEKDAFAQLLEQEKREEDAKYSEYPYRFSITIKAPIEPIERGERFEDPLAIALGKYGVVFPGGSSMKEVDGLMVVTDVGFSARCKDFDNGLAVIRKCLKEQGAPTDTIIALTKPHEAEYSLDE